MVTAEIGHSPQGVRTKPGKYRRWTLKLPQNRLLHLGEHPLVAGVVNITPDSFSDGGKWLQADAAIEHASQLLEAGADLLDLGAESTRPGGGVYGQGAEDVSVEEELRRLLPVLESVRALTEVPLSVDTRKGRVAQAALDAGADLINDVSAGEDPDLLRTVAAAQCPLVLMHSRGSLSTMQTTIHFDDLLAEVRHDLRAIVDRAVSAGIDRDQLIIDPGIGFGKTPSQNLELLRQARTLEDALQLPVMIGASRKSFIGEITQQPPTHRLGGSLAAAAWAAQHNMAIIRVHDVAETRQFLDVWLAIESSSRGAA